MSSRRGHTLTELLVVLAILSLFALVAVPRMIDSLGRRRMDAAVDAVRGDLGYARARAIATGLRHQVLRDPQSGEILVLPFHPEEGDGSGAGGGTGPVEPDIALRETLPEDIRLVEWRVAPMGFAQGGAADQSGELPLIFYPEGRGDGARVVLEDARGTRRGLLVDPFTGEIREMDPEELRQ